MQRLILSCCLVAVIAFSVLWAGIRLNGQRAARPVPGLMSRSKVDRAGHARGIVQVDLMRQIMAGQAGTGPSAAEPGHPGLHRVPSQAHPLLGRAAPALILEDSETKPRDLQAAASEGPVVIVFYLGSTCMACLTHLVELEAAMPRFQEHGTEVWAVSADRPELSRERMRRFGSFRIPLLSDPKHAVASAFGVWKPVPGGNPEDGEALHGTFIVARGGSVRWAHIGDRPFTDIDALLAEIDGPRPTPP
jgi:peroxiredoxin